MDSSHWRVLELKYEKVVVTGSSLISNDLYKNTKLTVDFAQKRLNKQVIKSEDFMKMEDEIVDLLKSVFPQFSLVHRDLNYDLLNISIQNLLDQAKDALGLAQQSVKPKTKPKNDDE